MPFEANQIVRDLSDPESPTVIKSSRLVKGVPVYIVMALTQRPSNEHRSTTFGLAFSKRTASQIESANKSLRREVRECFSVLDAILERFKGHIDTARNNTSRYVVFDTRDGTLGVKCGRKGDTKLEKILCLEKTPGCLSFCHRYTEETHIREASHTEAAQLSENLSAIREIIKQFERAQGISKPVNTPSDAAVVQR